MKIIDVLTSPWAIQPEKLSEIISIYGAHVRGDKIDIRAIEAQIGKPLVNERKRYEVIDGVAVIPVEGVLAKKMNMFMEISGGTSTQLLMKDFKEALADESVESILLHIDSPGGTVDGTQELAGIIYGSRGIKPITALADGLMASAAYWIGAAADAVYISSGTTTVGSIGVVAAHEDWSRYEEKIGVKTTEIYAGKYKRIYSEHSPLSEEGRQTIQEQVDYIYSIFVGDIGEYRGKDPETVISDMADGRVFIGAQAVTAGLVDGIMNFEKLLNGDLRQAQIPKTSNGDLRHPSVGSGIAQGSLRVRSTSTGSVIGIGQIPKMARVVTNESENNSINKKQRRAEMPQVTSNESVQDVITVESIRAGNPEIARTFYDEGYAAGNSAGMAAGAEAERARIADVEAQSMPGHEKLIAALKFDGKTTGPEAAVKVLAAEKQANAKALTNLETKSPEVIPQSMFAERVTTTTDGETADDVTLKKKWDADANLRAEFLSYDNYQAFMVANSKGRVKYYRKEKEVKSR